MMRMKLLKLFILLNILIFNLRGCPWAEIGDYVKVIETDANSLNCEILHLIGKTGVVLCNGNGEIYYPDGWTSVTIYCVKIEGRNYRIPTSNLKKVEKDL